ncbi:MAG: hypothetical protein ACYC8T_20440 [Myxococcaceae bacterium]
MSCFIILSDGRAWSTQSWVFDAALGAIAEVLAEDESSSSLAAWLLEEQSAVVGLGLVDVRNLTPDNQQRFLDAVPRALVAAREKGVRGWHDLGQFSAWIASLELLLNMIESVMRGDPPEVLNPNMKGVIPPTGERQGPGW